jgi:hypothetical protein
MDWEGLEGRAAAEAALDRCDQVFTHDRQGQEEQACPP